MDQSECRALILSRLRERDRKCAQFERIIRSYQALADSMQHLMIKNSRLMAASGARRSTASTSGVVSGSKEEQSYSMDNDERILMLQTELSDLYKKKALNDQQLIDANNRLTQLERELRTAQLERDTALKKVDALKEQLELVNEQARQLRKDNRCLLDEHIALQAAYSSIEEKFVQADRERSEMICRMKELKEREISLVNEMNEREQQLQLQRIRCELAEASKPNPMLDAKAYELIDATEAADATGSSVGARERLQSFGDVIPDRCRFKFECNEIGEVNDVHFHPNGKYFFTAGIDKKIKMWEAGMDTCAKRAEFTGANQGITRIDIHIENGHILGASNDFAVRVWSLDDQRQRFAFTGHSDKVTTAKFLTSGRLIASGSNDRTIKLWDTITNRCQKTFFPGSTICDLATTQLGAPLISAHFDKTVRFWDIRSGELPTSQVKLGAKVTSLFVAADGLHLLCSSRDETLTLLDLRKNATLHVYSAEQYRTSSDYSRAVISPGDSYVSAGSADGHIFIWNLHTTRLEKVLFRGGHENAPVLSLAWHPSGHMLISGDKRKTVCLWK